MGLLFALPLSFSGCQEDLIGGTDLDKPVDNLPNITGFPSVGTNQMVAFNNSTIIGLPNSGEDFYGQNANYFGNEPYYVDNGDGTITDHATELMWMQEDNAEGILWEDALSYAENMEYAGHTDWRLPDAKELQSILDYTRSPATTGTAAIDPLFSCTQIFNEAGEDDYPWYWSSTTHDNWTENNEGAWGAYVSFGRAMGNMSEILEGPGDMAPMASASINSNSDDTNWIDVYGAGAQRSDPKAGDPSEHRPVHGSAR